MANPIGITRGVQSWVFQQNHVERHMDNAAYEAAHPDDTLVLAGPPRRDSLVKVGAQAGSNGVGTLLAIGMLQSVQFTQSKPTQPMMAIGSGRSFFVSGKAQTQWNIARLFVNGRNLLRVLYHNALMAGVDVSKMDDQAALKQNSQFFINLDSELYYVPFGLAAFFRNKAHDVVGAFYCELSMINSYAIGMTAGQNMMIENVSGLADRLVPISLTDVINVGSYANGGVPRATLDQALDFASPGTSPGATGLANPTTEFADNVDLAGP
jgi:hypothetical protein